MKIGYILFDGYPSPTRTKVEIIAATKMRYRIMALQRMKIADRWIQAGTTTMVPKGDVLDIHDE